MKITNPQEGDTQQKVKHISSQHVVTTHNCCLLYYQPNNTYQKVATATFLEVMLMTFLINREQNI